VPSSEVDVYFLFKSNSVTSSTVFVGCAEKKHPNPTILIFSTLSYPKGQVVVSVSRSKIKTGFMPSVQWLSRQYLQMRHSNQI
jgi:hypothetical protein